MQQSFVDKLDPRTKFLALILLAIGIAFTQSRYSLAVIAIIILVSLFASSLQAFEMLKKLKRVFWFVAIITVIQMFTTSGEVILSVGGFYATKEGMMEGIFLSIKIVLLFVASSLFVATTPTQDMLDAVELVLSKFKKSGSIFFLLSIALNFVPLLLRTAQQIKAAQIARGADVDSSFVKQVQFASSAALPLFVTSFRASQHLADAMEARGFDAHARRTPFRELHFHVSDWLVVLTVGVIVVGLLLFESAIGN